MLNVLYRIPNRILLSLWSKWKHLVISLIFMKRILIYICVANKRKDILIWAVRNEHIRDSLWSKRNEPMFLCILSAERHRRLESPSVVTSNIDLPRAPSVATWRHCPLRRCPVRPSTCDNSVSPVANEVPAWQQLFVLPYSLRQFLLASLVDRRCQFLGFTCSFSITFLWLQHACWKSTACQMCT